MNPPQNFRTRGASPIPDRVARREFLQAICQLSYTAMLAPILGAAFMNSALAAGGDEDSKRLGEEAVNFANNNGIEATAVFEAIYLYKFAASTKWPAKAFTDANSSFKIAILGDDPWNGKLDQILKRPVDGRRITVRSYRKFKDVEECHILFIGMSEKRDIGKILQLLKGKDWSVLTVSEIPGFQDRGGGIEFVVERSAKYQLVKYQVNPDSVTASSIVLSPEVLGSASNASKD